MAPKRNATHTSSEISAPKIEKIIREVLHSELASQQSRNRATDLYTQRLLDTDAKVSEFIQKSINETTRAYRLTVNSYIANQVAAFILLLAGIVLTFVVGQKSDYFILALVLTGVGVILIFTIQNRSPVKYSRQMIDHLAKLNVIFASYVRQIHQIDSMFQELVENRKDFSPQTTEQLLNNLQDAMIEAMNAITNATNDSDN